MIKNDKKILKNKSRSWEYLKLKQKQTYNKTNEFLTTTKWILNKE